MALFDCDKNRKQNNILCSKFYHHRNDIVRFHKKLDYNQKSFILPLINTINQIAIKIK